LGGSLILGALVKTKMRRLSSEGGISIGGCHGGLTFILLFSISSAIQLSEETSNQVEDDLTRMQRASTGLNHFLRGKKDSEVNNYLDLPPEGPVADRYARSFNHFMRGRRSDPMSLRRLDGFLRGRKAASNMNHFLRGKKSNMNHFLRGRRANMDMFLRGRKSSFNHYLRGKKSNMNHFLRGKKDPTFLDMEEEDLQQPSNPYTYSTEDDLVFEYPDASMTASAE